MKKIFLLAVCSVLALSGCQTTDNVKPNNDSQASSGPVPFSAGPKAAPEIIGPSNPPPVSATTNQPQAVTEKENIRLTLPVKQD